MDRPSNAEGTTYEGSVPLTFGPSGKSKGPAKRTSIFYNPAMRMNRDLTVALVQTMIDMDMLPGKGEIRILDALCGTGIRGMRIQKEVRWGSVPHTVHAVDHNEDAITIGSEIAKEIGCDIQFHRASLCTHLYENRYSYIDIDPYGSPLPFVTAALSSILPGGVIAVTATDTAALCGSNTRVAMRRYAAQLEKTEYMKEISCRVLACYLARTAASMELSIEPLLFIASDHYVRGFIRVRKGAKKADETVKLIGQVIYGPPERPMPPEMGVIGRILGPMWLGRLEDVDTVHALSRDLMIDGGISEHMSSVRSLSRIAETATGESDLPPFGFDTDAVASYLSASPPPMDDLVMHLIDRGFPSARSRFGGKIVRTSALFSDIAPLFREV